MHLAFREEKKEEEEASKMDDKSPAVRIISTTL